MEVGPTTPARHEIEEEAMEARKEGRARRIGVIVFQAVAVIVAYVAIVAMLIYPLLEKAGFLA